jgi:uncharacterized membrane protein YeaQ/YmgE (transglycosylase-associated protein family)
MSHGPASSPGGGHAGHEGHPPSSVGPRATRIILGIFFAACALAVLADFVAHRHVEHPWEGLFAFYALWGFVGIVVLVFLSKLLRRIVMRPEDYYDAH